MNQALRLLLILLALLVSASVAKAAQTLTFTNPETKDTIEIKQETLDAGEGTCTLVQKGVRTEAAFKLEDGELITITPKAGKPLKLKPSGMSLVGEKTYVLDRASLAELEKRAEENQCFVQMKQLHTGCRMYAIDHNDKFPNRLEDLFPTYMSGDPKTDLVCPLSKDKAHPSYTLLLPGASESKVDQTAVLIRCNHASEGGSMVVRVNGAVEPRKEP